MKHSRILLMVTGTLAAGPVLAQGNDYEAPMLDQGTREASIAGRIELPELDEIDYDLDASYGYFFRDGWEVGIQISAADFGGDDRVELAGFTEYNFRRTQRWVPYVGGSIGLISADFGENVTVGSPIEDDDGLVFDVEGGVKYFLRSYMAVSMGIDFKFATEEVFLTDEAIEDNLTSIKFGMRYYF
jgi:hypothetical protein